MSRKTIAIIVEAIPLVSIVVFLASVFSSYDSPVMRIVTLVTSVLAFLGFVFFFIGRMLARGERIVTILGILDWFATLVTFQLYAPGLVRNTSDLSIVCHSDLQFRIMILSWKPSSRAYIALNDLCIQLIKPCSFFHEEQGFFQGRDRRATL